ncbi:MULTISPECIES: ABC transporter ATP-binding protein [Reichenbachiella]|uniref:ABC transporter ATP-binding protein n=1 Tax=Reichenbachiella TaxID=156993 RepID=UPI000E6BFD13|nr:MULTISPECIES: ABC transporter transmembrane domain-containing protein [Reichenbachiella]MBU2915842.1 ATP-binding cassette domain-containing protein [Reichenbachiella agariperforans]RJE71897.1 multidrug ABC transporter ATP-binding protein [Reichenbachiella sp. MSK19-1]
MAREKLKEEDKRKLNGENFKKLYSIFQYIVPYKSKFLVGLVFLVVGSFLLLAFPLVAGKLIDVAGGDQSWYLTDINQVALALMGILFLQGIISYFRVYLFAQVSENAMADVRTGLYQKLIHLPISFYDKNRTGDLMSRITADISMLQTTFSTTLAEVIRQIVTLAVGLTMIFITTPALSLFMLCVLPVIIFAAMLFGKKIRTLSRKSQDELAVSSTIAEETFQSILAVKSFTNESFEKNRFDGAMGKVITAAIHAAKYRAGFISFIIFALFGAMVAIIWYGAVLLQNGEMSIGDLISFVLYTSFIGGSIAGLGDLFGQIQRAIGASERVLEIQDEESETDSTTTVSTPIKGAITFDQVSFAYESRQDIQVLNRLSLQIKQGQKVALVGKSGAGKTTIAQLLMRLYNGYEGTIAVDGKEIKEYSLKDLRDSIGMVPQEIILFGGSIRENIAYGNPAASEEEVIAAARKAHAMDFIQSFPEGLDTLVGERGVKLSGGQRQRIAIARTILKNPSILILDEATSSLDAESENLVQQAFNELMKERTTLIIAHRLATIKAVDQIFVLEHGQIAESGTHDSLLSNPNSTYNHLVNLQLVE